MCLVFFYILFIFKGAQAIEQFTDTPCSASAIILKPINTSPTASQTSKIRIKWGANKTDKSPHKPVSAADFSPKRKGRRSAEGLLRRGDIFNLTEGKENRSPVIAGTLTPEQRVTLKERFRIEEDTIELIELRNQALRLISSPADPEDVVEELGKALDETLKTPQRQAIASLKKEYPEVVRNTELYGTDQLVSPATRPYLSREEQVRAKSEGLVYSLSARAYLEPIIPEKEGEKAERRKRQIELFQKFESERGKLLCELSLELEREFKVWEPYFSYIEFRKRECVQEAYEQAITPKSTKIRKGEIIDAFEKFVAPYYKRIEILGYSVYFSPISLDFSRSDREGRANIERLKDMLCPIGADGSEMNYHHLTQHDAKTHKGESLIVLISYTLHTKYSGGLHFVRATYRDLPRTPVDRTQFTQARLKFSLALAEAAPISTEAAKA